MNSNRNQDFLLAGAGLSAERADIESADRRDPDPSGERDGSAGESSVVEVRADETGPVSTGAESSRRAIAALSWCRAVSENPTTASTPPERPTPAELRAIPILTVREALDAMLLTRHTEPGLDALHRMGLLDTWLPEVAAMVGFGDGEWRHKDVWKHTKQVVRQAVPRLEVRWGALLHDIGKPRTRSTDARGRIHFHGHAEVGAAMYRKRVAKRLAFEGALHERIHFLILHHLRASQYDGSWTDAAVRRFYREMGSGLTDLLDLSRADITTKRPEKKKRGLQSISSLAARIRLLQKEDAKVPPLPKGLGSEIMRVFQIPASKRLGNIRNELEARCNRGALEAGQDTAFYIEYLRENASDFGL